MVGLGGAATAGACAGLAGRWAPTWRASRARPDAWTTRDSRRRSTHWRERACPHPAWPVSGWHSNRAAASSRRSTYQHGRCFAAIVGGCGGRCRADPSRARRDRLVAAPSLLGHNWDAVIGNGTDPSSPEAVRRAALRARPVNRRSLRAAQSTSARIGGRPTGVPRRGIQAPRIALAHPGRGQGPDRDRRDPRRHEDGSALSACEIGDEGPGAHWRPLGPCSVSSDGACCRRWRPRARLRSVLARVSR